MSSFTVYCCINALDSHLTFPTMLGSMNVNLISLLHYTFCLMICHLHTAKNNPALQLPLRRAMSQKNIHYETRLYHKINPFDHVKAVT